MVEQICFRCWGNSKMTHELCWGHLTWVMGGQRAESAGGSGAPSIQIPVHSHSAGLGAPGEPGVSSSSCVRLHSEVTDALLWALPGTVRGGTRSSKECNLDVLCDSVRGLLPLCYLHRHPRPHMSPHALAFNVSLFLQGWRILREFSLGFWRYSCKSKRYTLYIQSKYVGCNLITGLFAFN